MRPHSNSPPSLSPRARLCIVLLSGAFLALPGQITAQVTPYLGIETIQLGAIGPTELTYRDFGTGSTNYLVEFVSGVGPADGWTIVSGAVVTDLGNGVFRVNLPERSTEQGYYRVTGLGGSVPVVTASFATTTVQAAEGDTVAPMLVFSAPFFGTIRYAFSGTLGEADTSMLSGEVVVEGAAEATIPITLLDNVEVGPLKHLTLHLESGDGYAVGNLSHTTLRAQENDTEWSGSLRIGVGTLGFVLTLLQSGDSQLAGLKSAGFGFFPKDETPAQVALTENTFDALVATIPLPGDATLLSAPGELTLELSAANTTADQLVSPDRIKGSARLITRFPTKPYLNTTNTGTFLLVSSPARPATNQVELVSTL